MLRAFLGAILVLSLIAAATTGAEPATQPADQRAEIERMRAEVERMRREMEEMRKKNQANAPGRAVAPVRVAPDENPRPAPVPVPPRPNPGVPPPVRLGQGDAEPDNTPEVPFAVGQRPPVRPIRVPSPGVSDEEIGGAISRAAENLMNVVFDESGNMRVRMRKNPNIPTADTDVSLDTGLYTLCTYALIQAGLASGDERLSVKNPYLKDLIDRMKHANADGYAATYACGIRITALAVYNRPEDRATMQEDFKYLIANVHGGCYTYGNISAQYGTNDPTRRFGDNSNAQYGLLGVWSAAELGFEAHADYWRMVETHWIESQMPSGQWGYTPNVNTPAARGVSSTIRPGAVLGVGPEGDKGTLSMTLAGVASLFVTHDYLDAAKFGKDVGRQPFPPPLARGLKWLEQGDNILSAMGQGHGGWGGGYNMYGVERVGLASGFKYFGRHDWYRELAEMLVNRQNPDGSFGDPIETAYCLLFLARGRHPIIMNKLRFEGAWANRPRDVANLARFASRELERPLNWQVVQIDRDWSDWTDSPVLYLASHNVVKLLDADYNHLRSFIDAGGLLFTHSDGTSPAFNSFIAQLGKKLYPMYGWADLPADSEIYNVHFKVAPRPRLRYLSNGSRILMLHSTDDIASAWQIRAEKTRRNIFDLGVNVFLYASGKTDLRNRLAGNYLPALPRKPISRMPLARIKYAGNWNPEPYAWEHFSRWLGYRTGLGVAITDVEVSGLSAAKWPMAHMTGTAAYLLADADAAAVRKYVEDGGVLLIDACGGSGAFGSAAVGQIVGRAFPGAKMQPMPLTDKLFVGGAAGMDSLIHPAVRHAATIRMGKTPAQLMQLKAGKGCIIYSPLDITTGILGANTYGVVGFQSVYAQGLVKNLILWVWDGRPE